jgi:hypothetical protein
MNRARYRQSAAASILESTQSRGWRSARMFGAADVYVPTESTFDETDYDGIIGRDVLPAYLIFLDYQTGTIYLKPNS